MAKRFFAGLGTGYIALVVNAAMMIVLMPFFLTHLGEEMTGIYIMIAGLSNVLNFGIGWLAEASSVTLSSRSHANRKNFLVKPIYQLQQFLFAGYGIFVGGAMLLASLLLPYFWHPLDPNYITEVQYSLVIFGINYFIFLLHNGDLAFLISQLRVDLANSYRAIYYTTFCVLAIVLLYLEPSIHAVFVAQLITTILLGIASQLSLRKYRVSWLQWSLPRRLLWKSVLMRIGGPIAAVAVLWGIMMYADTALVGFLLGPAAAAHFFAATKISDTLALLLIRISETATPYFARLYRANENENRHFFYLQFQRILLFLSLIAGIGYGLFGESVMKLWLGDAAPVLSPAIFWLAGAMILIRTMVKFEYNVMISIQSVGRILPISLLETIIRVLALVICIHLFGIIGVALSFVLSYAGGLYWLIKHYAMRAVGTTLEQNLAQLETAFGMTAVIVLVWWGLQKLIWPMGYHVGVYPAIFSAILLGIIACATPILVWKKFPLFDYKVLFEKFDQMTGAKSALK